LNLVRESNAHLRSENEELAKKVFNLTKERDDLMLSLEPLRMEIRSLKSIKEGLESNNQTLTNDCNYWRDRLHQLGDHYFAFLL
jgi:FtsZ-binding cell division protein ZapB